MSGRAKTNTRRLRSTIQRVEQQPYDLGATRRLPRLSGGLADGYCRLSGSLGPATGTYPSLTPTSTSVTIYKATASGLVAIGAGTQTVYNFRNVTWAASKTTYVVNSHGIWKIVDQDC